MDLLEKAEFDLWPQPCKVAQDVAQYPLHHVTYVLANFEVATSNGLEDEFTRKNSIWTWPWHVIFPSTLYIMRPMYLQILKLLCQTV